MFIICFLNWKYELIMIKILKVVQLKMLTPWCWIRLRGRNMLEWLISNKINPEEICAFCWFIFSSSLLKNALSRKTKQKRKISDQWNVSENFNGYFNTQIKNNLLNDNANSIDNFTHLIEQTFTKPYQSMESKNIFRKKNGTN